MIIKKSRGLTLLETLLVLVIGSSLILLGFAQYQTWSTERDYEVLKYNVDTLFQGMKQYYQINCGDTHNTNGSIVTYGELSPTEPPAGITRTPPVPDLTIPFVVDIDNLQPYLNSWPRVTSVVKDLGHASSYQAQFNPETNTKDSYACYTPDQSPATVACSTPTNIAKSNVIYWQAQVVVEMEDPKKTVAYLGVVGADCAVNTVSTTAPVDCSKGITDRAKPAKYMVWQRFPSYTSTNIRSSSWVSAPVSKEFNLQYTNDPMYEMYNTNNSSYTPQNYLCGG